MTVSRCVIHTLLVLGLWLGLGLQARTQTRTVHYYYTDPQGTPLVKAHAQGNVIARDEPGLRVAGRLAGGGVDASGGTATVSHVHADRLGTSRAITSHKLRALRRARII
ncbi:hypothetical protein [Fulvimonas soli]|uniref:hypothetical protein n=1 Tax=Fulvimonas soli TaxID=155197 RepID=UPI0011B26598|nr:hypothetical protein [Fulvimonas soli]